MTSPIQLVGRVLGHYRLLEQIGAGGMGVVFRATDERLKRPVAVKVLAPGLLASDDARRRFRNEALALAKLNHPNIAAVHDVGEQDGRDYLVMEYVQGLSLAEKLKSGPLPPGDVLLLGAEVAAALEEAHLQGVVHRDLKPQNIVVTPKGHAKVLDFGLAKLRAPADSGDVTQTVPETKGPIGTPLYMSPEQAEGRFVDARTDLWSLGVILYESLGGEPPFRGASGLAVLRAVVQENPKPLRERRGGIPAEANRIVSRALEKDPARRYQSAAEMGRDLSDAITQLGAAAPTAARREIRIPRASAIAAAILAVLLAVPGAWLYYRSDRRHWAREEAIPGIARLRNEEKSLAAFRLLEEAQRYLPADPQLTQIAHDSTTPVSITSSPSGATVELQDYLSPGAAWYRLGTTPLNDVRIPDGYLRWRISKEGFGEYIAAPPTRRRMSFALDAEQRAPEGMAWVEGGPWAAYIDFIGWVGPFDLPAFYIDRFEVTNRQFQVFVDRDGYRKRDYWKEQFVRGGRELGWDEAMSLFRDRTGRAGPSTWEGGHYPEGQAAYPVSGVSWYEASAYAAFAGKSLPVLTQWMRAAPPEVATYAVRASNISRSDPAPVGTFKGLGPYGTYDMAGNVREWAENPAGDDRFILGGAWNSPTYLSADPEAIPAFDRSPANGFRCVQNLNPVPQAARDPVKRMVRDFSAVKPISDQVFSAYQAMYTGDGRALESMTEGVVQQSADWREEKVTFNTGYRNERMAAYLFLPTGVKPPFQAVVFFPSARVLDLRDSQTLGDVKFFDYIIQSGRAVLYPVYKGTYERQEKLVLPGVSDRIELVTERYEDLARSVDYLETRPDIAKGRLAYLGVSMGAAYGVIYAALLQDRLSTAIFLDGGFFLSAPPAEIDQANFAPRIKKPVLMVNGRYDFSFSLERAQNPLFRMLGSPPAGKRHVVLEASHDVTQRRPELVREVLGWLDRYLGRVE